MSAAAAHAARQKNKAKKEAAAAKENSPSKWSFRSKKVEDEPSDIVATDGDDADVEYSKCFPTLEVERPRTDGFFLNKLRYYQPEDKYIYEHVYVQIFVAILIMGNFGVNIAEAQIGTNGYAIDDKESGRGSYKDKGGYKETTYDGTEIYFKRDEDSHLSSTMRVFVGFEEFFFWAFLIELSMNYYRYADYRLNEFWKDGWNCFDSFIVGVTVLFKMPFDLPVYLKYLRLLRAFRVFRLFKRIKSLNKIIVSLGKAVPGVSNAFLILLLVMAIYAILGVELFSQLPCGVNNRDGPNSCVSMNGWMAEGYHLYGLQDSTCTGTPTAGGVCTDFSTYNNWDKTQANCPAGCVYTADGWGMDGRFKWGGDVGFAGVDRPADGPPALMCAKEAAPGYGIVKECRIQYHYGQEYWGNFMKSLYTLFQVLTGESWSEAVARPLLEWSPVPTAIYFVSFMLLNGIVLINVVVAVLLEKMVDEDPPPEDEGGDEPITEEGAAGGAPPRPDADGDALMTKLEAIQKQLDVLTAQRDAVRVQPAAAA